MTPKSPSYFRALLALCLALAAPPPSVAALDHVLTYKIKDSRGRICSAEAPQQAGAPCTLETDCGGTEDDSAFCVPKGFPKGLTVSLTDRFEAGIFDVLRPVSLGAKHPRRWSWGRVRSSDRGITSREPRRRFSREAGRSARRRR